jgi:D-tyrosyl-tRNA(Tyr) deacylase
MFLILTFRVKFLILLHKIEIFFQMRTIIQRVYSANVEINNEIFSKINKGLLILVGIEELDNEEDADWLAKKIVNMRIFGDEQGKMNLSLLDVQGDLLVVSQFTLHASTKKGNRPSFIRAAKPDIAVPLYEYFVGKLEELLQKQVKTGVFGENMKISLINDGPVTIFIDTKNKE